MGFFSDIFQQKESVLDQGNPNALVEALTGKGTDDHTIEDLKLVQRHGIRLNTRQVIALNSLKLLNERYKDPIVDDFIEGFLELKMYGKDNVKNIMKTIEYKENKRFTENINTIKKL